MTTKKKMNCRSAITVAAIAAAAALCESDICMTADNIRVLLLYMFACTYDTCIYTYACISMIHIYIRDEWLLC